MLAKMEGLATKKATTQRVVVFFVYSYHNMNGRTSSRIGGVGENRTLGSKRKADNPVNCP